MSWNLVQLGQVAPVAWHNGGGLTRELLAWPAAPDWTIRLSVAEVAQDGPFSQLPGVQRWFAVLAGNGVRLRVDGAAHQLTAQSPPCEFDGGAATGCELLGGATRDFNLMLRQGSARMWRVSAASARQCKRSAFLAAYANAHALEVRWKNEELLLAPNTLAWRILDSDGLVQLAGEDALWMEIEP
jgi:uncharacterized protein